MKKLTLEYIEDLATGPSLARGRSYYLDGAVEKTTKKENVYEARVRGTYLYKVSTIEADGEYHFFCNCPYDFGDICKHCVAVGMAIVDGKFIVEEKALAEEDEASHISVEQFLEEVYSPSDPDKKEEFLKMLLETDEELRAQFYSFVNETEDPESPLSVDEIRNKVYKIISEFDFSDIDYDYYYSTRPQHGYVEEWEIHYDLAKEMIEHAFDGYASQAIAHVKKGNLVDGMKVVLGLYEGCQNIYLPENDPYCIFEDGYNNELMDQVKKVIDKTAETIQGTVKTTTAVKRNLELLIQRYHHYDQIDHSEGESEIWYNLSMFRDLMLVLLTNEEVAHFLHDLFGEYDVDRSCTAFVRLRITEISNDKERWLEEAEVFAAAEPEIARQLMDHYLKQEKRDEFYRVAKQAFQNWPSEFDEYLIVKVSKKEQRGFYTKVLAHVTERKEDIERYRELRGLFSEQEKNKFIERNTVNRIFYVKLLAVEERFGEILDYVEEHSDSFDFARLIRPILNVYPEESFNLIRDKTDETLKDQRGRTVYQRLIRWLLEMKKIGTLEDDIARYFEEIMHRKPILPALRDEMRKARLI